MAWRGRARQGLAGQGEEILKTTLRYINKSRQGPARHG